MKRSASLRRRTALKPSGGLKRGGRLAVRPKRRTAEERAEARAWGIFVRSRDCEICSHRGEICEGHLEAHHVIEKKTLKKRGLKHLLWDTDNGLCACERAHRRHTNRSQPIERCLLRPENDAFAFKHDLVDVLDRVYVGDERPIVRVSGRWLCPCGLEARDHPEIKLGCGNTAVLCDGRIAKL